MSQDTQLISASLDGDTDAFGQLAFKYQDRLFNTLTYLLGSQEEAEDILQDALFQAYTKLQTFQGNSSFYTWLYRIGVNLALSHRRKKKNQPQQSVELRRELAGEDVASDAEEPLESVLRSERSHQLHQALNSLDDEQRSVLVLRELEGCNYDEISSILDLPPGTVRSRLHRGRKALRVLLQHQMDDSITPPDLTEVQQDQ